MHPRRATHRYSSSDTNGTEVHILEFRMEIPDWAPNSSPLLYAIIVWPNGIYRLVEAGQLTDIGPVLRNSPTRIGL